VKNEKMEELKDKRISRARSWGANNPALRRDTFNSKEYKENTMFTTNHYKNLVKAVKGNEKYRGIYFPADTVGAEPNGDTPLDKYYTFDELGHIMVATTSKDNEHPSPELIEDFHRVEVFFSAWTAALRRKDKNLFDYDAITAIIEKSGYFINTEQQKRDFSSSSTAVTLDTTIIENIISCGVGGTGIAIAKRTLAAIGNQIKIGFDQKKTDKEICNILFVVESLMTIPIISLSIFHTTYDQMSWVQTTSCSEVCHNSIKFSFSGDDYIFVAPSLIDKYTPEFRTSKEYEDFITTLEGFIP
jgi:hypothetical protein